MPRMLRIVKLLILMLRILMLLGLVTAIGGCFNQSNTDPKVITVSITPWPGYYPLYFAIEKNIARQQGVELRVIETLTLDDFSRANIKEHVDAFSLTAMELIRANSLIDEAIHFAVFMDYSNGADVIIARKEISGLEDLQGKKVGYEFATLGHLFLKLANVQSGINEPGYESLHVDQLQAAGRFKDQSLDAFVTFPPVSTELLQNDELHVIYDSSKIPYQIVDFLMIKDSRRAKLPLLREIWYQTLAYIEENPAEYQRFLASLMNISEQDVPMETSGLELLNKAKQSRVQASDVNRLMSLSCNLYEEDMPDCVPMLDKLLLNGIPLTRTDVNE